MSTFVIAGASGHVGSAVATTLLDRGARVVVMARTPERLEPFVARGARAAPGPLEDTGFLARTLAGADGCFVLLPEDPRAADVHGPRRAMADAIVDAVRASGVPHVVMLSALAASLAEGNGPAADLHYLEAALANAGVRRSIVRGCWFQENVGAVIPAAAAAGIYPNLLPSADVPLPTVATRDVGGVAADALMAPPPADEIIDVHGPAYTIRQMAQLLSQQLGRPLRVIDIPPAAQVLALRQAGLSPAFAAAVAELTACFAAGRVTPAGDRAVLGTTTLEDVLPGLVARARS